MIGRGGFVLVALVAVTALAGCDDDGEGASPVAPPGKPAESARPAAEPPKPTGDGDETGAEPAALPDVPGETPSERTAGAQPPAGGCVEAADRITVWPRRGPAAVASRGDAFLVAGYAPDGHDGEQIFVVSAAAGSPATPVTTAPVDPSAPHGRSAPPGLLVDGGRAWIARIDGAGVLAVAGLELGRPGAALRFDDVAEGADARFAPALARIGDVLAVAWVDGSGTPMRVKVARVSLAGEVRDAHDVTLEAMGGAAPVFVAGASPPRLVFVDPRSGISPIVAVPFAPDGTPRTGRVALSVGQVTEPPSLAAAATSGGVAVGYTAIGSGATTAVGLVRLEASQKAPVALVKGTGYGALRVAAAALGGAALFVSEAPTAPAKDAPRVLEARLAGPEGAPGPALTLAAPAHVSAESPAAARASDGTIAVAFEAGSAVRLALLRCAPAAPLSP